MLAAHCVHQFSMITSTEPFIQKFHGIFRIIQCLFTYILGDYDIHYDVVCCAGHAQWVGVIAPSK